MENKVKGTKTKDEKKLIRRERRKQKKKLQKREVATELKTEMSTAKAMIKQEIRNSQPKKKKEFEKIAKAISLPMDTAPVRWSSIFSSQPTAVAAPWSRETASFTSSASNIAGDDLPCTDCVAFAFREPLRARIIRVSNEGGFNYEYQAYGNFPVNGLNSNGQLPTTSWNMPAPSVVQTRYLHIPYWKATTSYSPHGDTLFAGTDVNKDGRYVWMEANTVVSFQSTGVASQGYILSADLWTPDGVSKNLQSVSWSASGSPEIKTISMTNAGYYCFQLNQAAVLLIQSLKFASTSPNVFAHKPMPNYEANLLSATAIRTMAVSMMFTNNASPLNRQGKIVQYQSPQSDHWTDYVSGTDPFNNASNKQGSCTRVAEKGAYTWLKFTQPQDFDYYNDYDIDGGVLTDSYYPLQHGTSFLVTYVRIVPIDGRDGYWTWGWGLEYQTDDVWREVDVPEFEEESFQEALTFLAKLEQYHENPLHWGELWNKIKAGAQKYGIPALKAAGKALLTMI